MIRLRSDILGGCRLIFIIDSDFFFRQNCVSVLGFCLLFFLYFCAIVLLLDASRVAGDASDFCQHCGTDLKLDLSLCPTSPQPAVQPVCIKCPGNASAHHISLSLPPSSSSLLSKEKLKTPPKERFWPICPELQMYLKKSVVCKQICTNCAK